jgi:putative tryptophan/tyrosine transport system substrate-binding protein
MTSMAIEIRRREFICALGAAAGAWPLAARAQQTAMPVIGSLYAVSAAEWTPYMVAFRSGLAELNFVEGKSVIIESRWAESYYDRLPGMAADLVGRKVSLILAGGSVVAVRAAMTATQSIPIVFTTAVDPVAAGLVASLNRPGGNITGATLISAELAPKRLELLHSLIPAATRIALLTNPNNPAIFTQDARGVQEAARAEGKEIIVVSATNGSEIAAAFEAAVKQGAGALLVGSDAIFVNGRSQIAEFGLRYTIPVVFAEREGAAAGGLMSYGASFLDTYRQAGIYVGRILKGEKPANLPIVQPTKFELVINLKTAKALGVSIPTSLLVAANEIIE